MEWIMWIMEWITHLGFGTNSSGTGVQIDSGDFCSLKRPSKMLEICSMSKAQMADPGMLEQTETDGAVSIRNKVLLHKVALPMYRTNH